jgi:hypothetical protein
METRLGTCVTKDIFLFGCPISYFGQIFTSSRIVERGKKDPVKLQQSEEITERIRLELPWWTRTGWAVAKVKTTEGKGATRRIVLQSVTKKICGKWLILKTGTWKDDSKKVRPPF